MSSENIKNWAIGLAILVLALWNPASRAVIFYILPVGSGIDDLVFIVVAIAAVIAWAFRYANKKREEEASE